MSFRYVLLLVLLLCLTATVGAQDRYVSLTGKDSNTGLGSATAWRTLTHAAAKAPKGSTIHVGKGTFGTGSFPEGIEIKGGKKLFWHGQGMGKTIIKANAGFQRLIRYHYSAGSVSVAYTAVFVVHGAGSQADLWDLTLDANHLSKPTRLASAVYADGGSGLLHRVELRNAGAVKPDGNLRHVGLIANGTNSGVASWVTLEDCHVHHWNKVGVVLGGKKLTATIQTSVIEGRGPIGSGGPAQNGIHIQDGGTRYLIRDNLVRDIWFTPPAWNAVGILNLNAGAVTTIAGNRIFGCKTGYYHRDGVAGQVSFRNNRIAGCFWGATIYSDRLLATGNHIDADVGIYVGGAVNPKINGNYYSDYRSNSGFPSKYVADGNTAVQDLKPLAKPLGFDPAVRIPLGNGSGPEDLVTGDFNSDGRLDFAVANGGTNKVTVFFGSGGAVFSTILPRSVAVPAHPILLATGEFTGSVGQDLVCLAQNGKAYVLRNDGKGGFTRGAGFQVLPGSDAPTSIASGQLNGLDEDDFIVGYRGNGVSTPGGIKLLTVKRSVISSGLGLSGRLRSVEDVAMEDINGDAKPDILAVDTQSTAGVNNKLQVWVQLPTSSSYGAPISYSLGTLGRGLGVGDLDQDGDVDVAVSRDGSVDGWVHIFEGQGGTSPTGRFVEAAKSPFRIDTGATVIRIVDLQDDQDPDSERNDVVVAHPTKNKMTRLRRWKAGRFESYRGAHTGLDPRAFAFARLDRRLLPDLILAERGDHDVAIFLDDPDALIQEYGVGGAGSSGHIPRIVIGGAASLPFEGNLKFLVQVRQARASTVGVFLFSLDASLDQTACALQISFLSLFWMPAIVTDRFGNGSLFLPIPINPALVGENFYAQLAVFDPSGCFSSSFSLTQGIRLRIGH